MSDHDDIATALARGGIIDITTTGRTSGQPRRIEIVVFNIDGRLYISGMPGRRGWIANLAADPRMKVHLKRGVTADLPATARIVEDPVERRPIIEHVCRSWDRMSRFDDYLARAPLIEVTLDDTSLLAA